MYLLLLQLSLKIVSQIIDPATGHHHHVVLSLAVLAIIENFPIIFSFAVFQHFCHICSTKANHYEAIVPFFPSSFLSACLCYVHHLSLLYLRFSFALFPFHGRKNLPLVSKFLLMKLYVHCASSLIFSFFSIYAMWSILFKNHISIASGLASFICVFRFSRRNICTLR